MNPLDRPHTQQAALPTIRQVSSVQTLVALMTLLRLDLEFLAGLVVSRAARPRPAGRSRGVADLRPGSGWRRGQAA